MFSLYTLLFALSAIFSAAPKPTAASEVHKLEIANKAITPDGYQRAAIVINDKFPGPIIRANKGEEIVVQVFNKLTDADTSVETSVHWHGIFQHKSNWADGTSGITQCPLRPDETFEYRLNTTGQTGTYWYHSHYSTQYCDGLRGPLIIYDPKDPLAALYDVDDGGSPSIYQFVVLEPQAENTVITLADWYHSPSAKLGQLFAGVQSNATLINGLGRYSGGPASPLSVIKVKQGLRYRFRVVSMSCAPWFNFTIDGHRLTIIEADGNEVLPVEVDWLPIHSGQRYSVVVTADKPIGNYWVRALPSVAYVITFDGGQNLGILRYEAAPGQDPASDAGPYELPFDEGALHPLINPGAPGVPEIGKADVNIQLVTGINSSNWFTINNQSFISPSIPVLLQILSGARHPSQLLPQGSVYVLPSNKVIEINFPKPLTAPHPPHPLHLHGHAFDVVRVGGSNMTNFVDPVRRDVVSIGDSDTDNVTIRFVTDNAGPWFFHCHIEWHLNHGMAVVMAEAPDEAALQEQVAAPEAWYDLCGKKYT